MRRAELVKLLSATAAALVLAPVAMAGMRLIVEWDNHSSANTLPAGFTTTANEHFGPLTVEVGADGKGVVDGITTALASRVELGTGFNVPPVIKCSTGEVVNPPVQVKVSLYADGRVALTASHTGDGPCQKLKCDGQMGAVVGKTCVALTVHDVAVYFPLNSLKPGERTEVHKLETKTGNSQNQEHMWVTLDPCQPVPGASGNGSVLFESDPPLGTKQWPVSENDELTRAELNARFPPRDPDKPSRGVTDVGFPDSSGHQDWAPRADVRWNADPFGKGRCVYLDRLSLHFPQIMIRVAQEIYAARASGCTYSAVRGHEMRHALHFEDAFRAMQRRLRELLDDREVATPAHPRFAATPQDEEQLQRHFRTRMELIVREETEKLEANLATQDNAENYAYEHSMCKP